jgi:hypothetical protein
MKTEVGRLETLACALAGSTEGAAALLAAARLAASRAARQQPADADDDAALGRAAVVRAFLGTAGRRVPPPPAQLPDPDLESLRLRLAALAPLPRAVLVLRHLEELTLADLARLTERSGPAVARALATAATAVPATGAQLDLLVAAVDVPEPRQVETARRRLEDRRRRTRFRGALVALALAGLLAAATVLPGALRPDPYYRAVGAWVYGYDVRAPAGSRVLNRLLTPETDTVRMLLEDSGQPERHICDITGTSSERPAAPPAGRPARVGAFAGRFLAPDEDRGRALWWRTGPTLTMEASCSEGATDTDLLAAAALVVPAELPVQVPVDLSDLPAGEEVRGIYDLDGQLTLLVGPRSESQRSLGAVYVSVGSSFTEAGYRETEQTVQLGAVTARVRRADQSSTICWDVGGPQACVADFTRGEPTSTREQRFERMLAIARAVRTAADAADRSTWFDAREAVPG